MKSSTGEHYVGLDHVRAVAAFMVVAWHFTHGGAGYPVPFDQPVGFFPLALLDEGHTGVAVFMTLSGFLFAKLLDGRVIKIPEFLYNRMLRLLPLLVLVILVAGVRLAVRGEPLGEYARSVLQGVVLPSLPNGGWSIAVEFHYYLLLPALLWMMRRSRWLPLSVVLCAIALRCEIFAMDGTVQTVSYFTIIGRIDQFVLGMLAFRFRHLFVGRHLRVGVILTAFMLFYQAFNEYGGFYGLGGMPSPSVLWVLLPTIEGVAYASAVAWYDGSFSPRNRGVSWLVGRMGAYSYSIYLLHFFVVFRAARFVHEQVMDISSFPLATAWAVVFFVAMTAVGHLCFRVVEEPFLRMRKQYLVPRAAHAPVVEPAGAVAARSPATPVGAV